MSDLLLVEHALAAAVADLAAEGRTFALVGGLAVSVRAEVRFTRDVDLAVSVRDDTEAEALVFRLHANGYRVLASVEHEVQARLSTVRLLSPSRVKLDLLFASSGIEPEVVSRAVPVTLPGAGLLPVARAEELLAMKVLSMNEQRLQDRIDASKLLSHNPEMNLDEVRSNLQDITARGFNRGEDLEAKLAALLRAHPGV
jgi:hypothetical protein